MNKNNKMQLTVEEQKEFIKDVIGEAIKDSLDKKKKKMFDDFKSFDDISKQDKKIRMLSYAEKYLVPTLQLLPTCADFKDEDDYLPALFTYKDRIVDNILILADDCICIEDTIDLVNVFNKSIFTDDIDLYYHAVMNWVLHHRDNEEADSDKEDCIEVCETFAERVNLKFNEHVSFKAGSMEYPFKVTVVLDYVGYLNNRTNEVYVLLDSNVFTIPKDLIDNGIVEVTKISK